MDYNPQEISYEELLRMFWQNHSPEYKMPNRQYMSAIFYHDEEQRVVAMGSLEEEHQRRGKLYTEIRPFERFYLAEAYHQKYYLQMVTILKDEIRSRYSDFRGFVDSTAAARVNGYLKGLSNLENLMQEVDLLGLSDKAKKRLIEIVDSY